MALSDDGFPGARSTGFFFCLNILIYFFPFVSHQATLKINVKRVYYADGQFAVNVYHFSGHVVLARIDVVLKHNLKLVDGLYTVTTVVGIRLFERERAGCWVKCARYLCRRFPDRRPRRARASRWESSTPPSF